LAANIRQGWLGLTLPTPLAYRIAIKIMIEQGYIVKSQKQSGKKENLLTTLHFLRNLQIGPIS
jgi:hypothetical protein